MGCWLLSGGRGADPTLAAGGCERHKYLPTGHVYPVIFVSASHQTGLDIRFFFIIQALLDVCWLSAYLVQWEPDEPDVGLELN